MALRRLIPLAAVLAVALTFAAPAGARSGAVTVDPDSPSGKEYAIPLESARRAATKGTDDGPGSASQGQRSAPLFGEGVGGAPAGGGSKPGSSHAQLPQRTSRRSAAGAAGRDAVAGARPVRATVPAGGVGSVLTIGAVAVSVLLLGAVLGSIARRRSG